MKNKPLFLQIWIVFASITLFISIMLSVILPLTLRNFFTEEMYITIESAQKFMFSRYDLFTLKDLLESQGLEGARQTLENIRTVRHFFIYEKGQIFIPSSLSMEFVEEVVNQAKAQENVSQRYSGEVNGEKIFYVITKGTAFDEDVFLISYMWDSYRQDLVKTLFKRLALVMFIVSILSWIPAALLSKYLSNPLVALEKKVKKLANYEWNEPIDVDREDEIGRLGKSIEQLRNQLIYQAEMQKSFLQNISHELKTPVMVIRSFAQAIRDGIYPKNDLDSSVAVIDDEAERLEKRIRNLLYITKLDYLKTNERVYKNFYLDELIKEVIERFALNRTDIDWQLDLPPAEIKGDIEQWRVVIENLLDNQMRYAKNSILISLKDKANSIILKIWNDGPAIEDEVLKYLFSEYNAGKKGQFGLGLAIVQRIVNLHQAKIWTKNENVGVSFFVEIPKEDRGTVS
ncbi:MAG: HAMP domain-containing histidine kinase [Tissierellia bacterium]|nr:HAMP domain-containing histidine kinase [Tissierellia bacterium]